MTETGCVEFEETVKPSLMPTKKRESKEESTAELRTVRAPVLHLLRANDNCDIINILADKHYKEQDARKSYELIKK